MLSLLEYAASGSISVALGSPEVDFLIETDKFQEPQARQGRCLLDSGSGAVGVGACVKNLE